ncbi:NAD(P)/FAD-dependent oxidoreductase [Roseomonas sp. CCTCC AB2023176]|uniref:NAD(P)/FAD-dependent oxidoreductase n=1 Tax=Roseomonas sp. CCTCC AB2023176 TaxID=3342640 RepID=UPI0035D71466
MQTFDALVIGAGIGGATAAYHLSATRRVALLEAEESAGYHTTGRSAAIWILNYGTPDARLLTAGSGDFFRAPPPGFAEAPLMSPRPVIHLAPPQKVAELEAMIRDGAGVEPIAIEEEVRAMVPPLREGYAAAAAIERHAFDMDVAALHGGFLRALRARGGTMALRHRAGRLWHANGAWHAETSGGGTFAAPVLVNAAGAWGDEVARIAGVAPLGLQPKRRTAAIVDPAPHVPKDWPLLGDVGHSWYARTEARTKLMISPADETDSDPCDAQPDELDVAIAVERFQEAMDLPVRRIEHRWAGLRTFTPDRGLAIGASERTGFFWNVGQGGYGIQTSPAAGRLLGALVNGEDPGDLTPIVPLVDPRRFEARVAA